MCPKAFRADLRSYFIHKQRKLNNINSERRELYCCCLALVGKQTSVDCREKNTCDTTQLLAVPQSAAQLPLGGQQFQLQRRSAVLAPTGHDEMKRNHCQVVCSSSQPLLSHGQSFTSQGAQSWSAISRCQTTTELLKTPRSQNTTMEQHGGRELHVSH